MVLKHMSLYSSKNSMFSLSGKIILLVFLYCLTGAYGLSLALPPGYATIIWPPSGIAIGFLICYGWKTWPGILIGSFFLNSYLSGVALFNPMATPEKLLSAIVIASGSTLQAVIAYLFIRYKVGIPITFQRMRDTICIFLLVGPLSCTTAATVGVLTLYFSGIIPEDSLLQNWLTWWGGDLFGVVVFLPLVLIWPTHSGIIVWKGKPLKSLSIVAMLTLVVPLFLTFYAWKMSAQTIYEGEYKEFKALARESLRSLHDRLTLYDSLLLNGDGFIQGSKTVEKEEWRQFTNALHLSQNYPGLAGFGFIEYVLKEDLSNFIENVRKDNAPDFSVHPDLSDRPYYIIKFVEPELVNKQAIGLNIAFESSRREAAELSRDSGTTFLTQPIHLVQDKGDEHGFLLLRPIYKKDSSLNTTEERREAIRGWVYAPLFSSKLLNNLTESQSELFNISIYNWHGSKHGALIYSNPTKIKKGKYEYNDNIVIMGQNWHVEWSSTPQFDKSGYSFVPILNLLIGLVFTGLFAIFLVLTQVYKIKKQQSETQLANANLLRAVILDSSPALIVSTDVHGTVTSFNAAAEEALGYTADEVVAKKTPGIWHDLDEIIQKSKILSEELGITIAPGFEVFVTKANRGLPEKGIWTFIRKDGSTFKAELSVTATRNESGLITGYLGIIMDVSDRLALDRVRERLSLATSAAQIGVWEWLINENHFYWTDAMFVIHDLENLRSYNRETETLVSYNVWKNKIHPEDIIRLEQELDDAVLGVRKLKTMYRIITSEGEIHYIKLLAEVLEDVKRKTKRMIGVNWNVSAEYEAERIKSEFVSMMSHEIRTPLNGIIGTIDIITETKLDDHQKKYIGIIKKSAKLLMDIISDVLDFSKIEANKLELLPEPFSFSEIIEEHIALYLPLIEEKGLSCKYTIDDRIPDILEGDTSRIKQVLGNLINNAIKFTSKGGIEIRIEPVGQSENNLIKLKFYVEDTGDGMSEENVAKLFKPFTQVSASGAKNASGTGLGLTICKRIVEKMNGQIGVVSTEGKGSTFWFTIELKISRKEIKKNLVEQNFSSEQIPFKGKHILIVEDVETNQFVIATMLGSMGCTFDIANDGEKAVEAVQNMKYDCVLMDCMMPVMNGYDATKKIRSLGFHDLPIIALSANALAEDKKKGEEAGMNDYIPKPIVKTDIINTLNKFFT